MGEFSLLEFMSRLLICTLHLMPINELFYISFCRILTVMIKKKGLIVGKYLCWNNINIIKDVINS